VADARTWQGPRAVIGGTLGDPGSGIREADKPVASGIRLKSLRHRSYQEPSPAQPVDQQGRPRAQRRIS
jgi:hypothetical protein